MIAKRFFEKNALVRSKSLKVCLRLLKQENVLLEPKKLFLDMFDACLLRLRDPSSIVRKNALKLYS